MFAISLLQPWASLVIMGLKTIETRSWSTRHRGEILIHSSKGKAGALFADDPPFKKYIPDFEALPFGAIIGLVDICKILRVEDLEMDDKEMNKLTMEEKAFGDYSSGRYAWLLENPRPLSTLIPVRGMPGIWNFKGDSLIHIR